MSHKEKSIVTLGTFDGVHLGHQKIITRLLEEADRLGYKPILVTFFPHPSHVLTPEKPLKMINSIDERVELLKKQGLEHVVIEKFTKEFSNKTALDFIKERLLGTFQMKKLIVGYDHSFGKDKQGDFNSLENFSKEFDFEIEKVTAYSVDNVTVSSSLIRGLLLEGEINKVNKYLGYNFCLFGTVVKGNQLGRKIGFNTANIVLDYPNKIVPKKGVYVVQSTIDGQIFYGMMNIGYRPTVDGTTQTIEVHFFDLNKNLYDKKIRVFVLKRLRNEYKFENIEMLKLQLEQDKKNAIDFLKFYNGKNNNK